MIETKRKTVSGLNVAVTQFAGRRNFGVLIDLAAVAGPMIGAILGATGGATSVDDLLSADVDFDMIGRSLAANMNREKVMSLVDSLLENTAINERPIMANNEFDVVFAGPNVLKLGGVLAFVIEVNFGSFSELAASVTGGGVQAGAEVPPAS